MKNTLSGDCQPATTRAQGGARSGSRTPHEEKSTEGRLRASCVPVLPYRGVLSTSCTKSGLFGQAQTFDQGEYLEFPENRSNPAMFSPFHLLKVQSDGTLHWMEGAVSVERARARMKILAASSRGKYVITNLTGKKIRIESQGKRIIFQIGYSEKELHARAALFRCCGHEVISVTDNGKACSSFHSKCRCICRWAHRNGTREKRNG